MTTEYRVRKTAWELKPGDVVQCRKSGGPDAVVLKAKRMIFDGELDGVKYQNCPMVRIEYAGPPWVCAVVPGDVEFTVSRRVSA